MSEAELGEGPKGPDDFLVQDDLEPRERAAAWLREEMVERGRAPEDLAAELVGDGWPEDEAAGLVEEIRKETRAERGVVTRDDVVREAGRYHRGGTGVGLLSGFPTLAAVRRLLYSIGSFLALKRRSGR